MVDRLKQSIENLEPPACPDCHLEMKWYRSILASATEPQTVIHHFQCPNCHRIESRLVGLDKGNRPGVDPSKLSAPAHGFSCAA